MGGCLAFRIAIHIYFLPVATGFSYNCDNCGLSNIPAHIPPETTQLHLHGNQIGSISKNSLMALSHMTLLDIGSNMVTSVEFGSFSESNISNLILSYNQFTRVPHIEPLALSLLSLDLRNNRITIIEPYTFRKFTVLSKLYLLHNSITSLPGFALNMPHAWLDIIHLEYNDLATLDDLTFAELGVMSLKLDNNALTEFPCPKDIRMLHFLYLNSNPVSSAPVDCGPHWNTIRLVQMKGTRLASVDNITKYATSLYQFEAGGTLVTFSDETFKGTRYSHITMEDVSSLPRFHSSKLTLVYLELGGVAVRCINDMWLNGLANIGTFRLIDTSIDLLPNPGCSDNTYENRTFLIYFQSLRYLYIQRSPLIQFPNLTTYGVNGSLRYLYIRETKISSVPCFPDNIKFYHLSGIDLIKNEMKHICSLNFAPNIRQLYLSHNLLFDTLFFKPTNIPLSKLYLIATESIGMELLSDSILSVTHNCGKLMGRSNKISVFPNFKLIAASVDHIEL